MEKKEEMLEGLKNVVLRRMKAAGITCDQNIQDIVLVDLKGEWDTFGYDSARLRAERAELTAWAQ